LDKKIDIRLSSKDDIKNTLVEWGEAGFRANQILKEQYVIHSIHTDKEQFSNDGTIKTRFRLHDGALIESVLIPVKKDNRFTVCVSSQVGCSLACTFCATGKMKRMRNLDPGEIYDQVVKVNEQCLQYFDHPLTNVVYMGMGEPLLNYKNVMQSIHLLSSPEGLHMSAKRFTISTAGISKMIKKLADDESKVNLALSLHAADDEKRDKIMPINEQNDLKSLMEALKYYYEVTKNRLSYEYIAFKGFNDSIEDAEKLSKLCKHFPVRINVIEYNPIEGFDMIKSEADTLDLFAQHLRAKDIMVTVRKSRGKDIDAACGQLANKE